MGPKKVINNFIDSVPESKLENFSTRPKTLHKDKDLRLDLQGVTSNNKLNLQVQVNHNAKTTSLRQYAPNTVAGPVLVDQENPMSPDEIRQGLKDSVNV